MGREGLSAARCPAELNLNLIVDQHAAAQAHFDERLAVAELGQVDLVATHRTGQIGRQRVGIGRHQTDHSRRCRRKGVDADAMGLRRDAAHGQGVGGHVLQHGSVPTHREATGPDGPFERAVVGLHHVLEHQPLAAQSRRAGGVIDRIARQACPQVDGGVGCSCGQGNVFAQPDLDDQQVTHFGVCTGLARAIFHGQHRALQCGHHRVHHKSGPVRDDAGLVGLAAAAIALNGLH